MVDVPGMQEDSIARTFLRTAGRAWQPLMARTEILEGGDSGRGPSQYSPGYVFYPRNISSSIKIKLIVHLSRGLSIPVTK